MKNFSTFQFGAHLILFLAFSFILFSFSCEQSAVEKNKTVVIGLNGDIDSLNELTAADADALQIIRHMLFMTLTHLDKDLNFAPYFAKSWDFSNEQLTVTFHLRDDIFWSDGAKTTAEDVIFTYQTMINRDVAYSAASQFDLVAGVEKIDDQTIRFHLHHAYPDVLFDLQFPILPKHILGSLTPDEKLTSDFNRHPIGNGPFVLKKWEANKAIYFESNKNFAPEAPKIDQIIFSILPEETVLAANLLAHDIDIIPRLSHERLSEIAANKSIKTSRFESKNFTFIGWNNENPIFSAPIRRALTHAINKEEIINTLLQGFGKPAIGPLTPLAWAFDKNLVDIKYDPEAAKSLLLNQGWIDSDNDGVLDNNGRELAFSLKIHSDSRRSQDIAVMVQAQLKKLGVKVTIEQLEFNLFIDHIINQRLFEAVVMTWGASFAVDPTPLWHSDAIENGYNIVSYKNSRIDELLEQARYAKNRETAQPLWIEFQQTIIDDCPYTFLFIPDDIVACNKRVKNTEFDIRSYLANVQSWQISQ